MWQGSRSRRVRRDFNQRHAGRKSACSYLLDPFFPREAFIVDLGVRPAGAFRMPPRIEAVTMRDVGVVRRLVVCTCFVMPGGLVVVMRRLRVMFRGGGVMFDRLLGFGHWLSPKGYIFRYTMNLPALASAVESELSAGSLAVLRVGKF